MANDNKQPKDNKERRHPRTGDKLTDLTAALQRRITRLQSRLGVVDNPRRVDVMQRHIAALNARLAELQKRIV
jgi:hypothetical protein